MTVLRLCVTVITAMDIRKVIKYISKIDKFNIVY